MLPWVSFHRYDLEDNGDTLGDKFLDCAYCHECTEVEQRRMMQCGWVPLAERDGHAPAPWLARNKGPEPSVCPGYTISMPVVREACRALNWADRGLLAQFYGEQDLPPMVFDAIDVMRNSINEAEAYTMAKLRDKK